MFLAFCDLIFFFSSNLFLAFSILISMASNRSYSCCCCSFLLFSKICFRLIVCLILLFGVPSPGLFCKGTSNWSLGLIFALSLERGYSIYFLARPVAPLGTRSEAFLARPIVGFFPGTDGGFLESFDSFKFNYSFSSCCSRSNSLTISDSSFIY